MPSTYSPNLRIELIASGEQGNTWGGTTNNNLGTLIENAISGTVSIDSMPSNTYTLTVLNGANDNARNMYIKVSSSTTLSAAGTIIAPAVSKMYVITNSSLGGFAVTLKTSASTGISIPNGATRTVFYDGTDFVDTVTATKSLLLNADATLALQAVTKQQMDAALALKISKDGSIAMTGPLTLPGGAPTGTQAVSKTYADSFYLPLTNPTLITPLTLSSADPTGFQATSRSFTDFTYVAKTGSTMTGALTLYPTLPTTAWQAVPKQYVDNISVYYGSGISITGTIAANNVTVNLLYATTSTIGGVKVDGTSITINGSGVISAATSGGGVPSISATSPIQVNSGGGPVTTAATMSILQASTLVSGYLSSTDWNTFNGKQAALGYTPAKADGSNATGTWAGGCSGSAGSAGSVSWSGVTGRPSTLSGYGISDAISTSGSQTISVTAYSSPNIPGYIGVTDPSTTFRTMMGSYYSTSAGQDIPMFGSYVASGTSSSRPPITFTQYVGTNPYPALSFLPDGTASFNSLQGGGSVSAGAGTGVLYASSSQDLKVEDGFVTDALDDVNALLPRYYYWKDSEGNADIEKGRQLGFYAQEVQAICEEAAPTGLGIFDRSIIALLVKAIQELNAKVEALTAEVNTLKGA